MDRKNEWANAPESSIIFANLRPILVAHLYSSIRLFRKLSHAFLAPAQIEFPI
jgi:hypothetical protein